MSSARGSIVIGGSSGVGRALVQQLAARGDRVLAIARDLRDLEALQQDCRLRYGTTIQIMAIDVAAADFDAAAFTESCIGSIGPITQLFVPIGAIHADDRGVPAAGLLEQLAIINYLRPAQILGSFCKYFSANEEGHAMIFTSIATAAPRGNNAAYAAAKAGLEFYCRALQHHFADSRVMIQICALGYVDTTMSFGMKLLFPAARPEAVARFAMQMSEGRKRFAYFPRFWWPITSLLKMLPWPIYKRLHF
ncbi:MAG: SDR family NAD(P)-dependent oxidoreductase [Betaproteobacteria bacterium]|nr:SDR family NAD(P)-dependent oxidoreductase [Betaproteobacteria bacterium]